MVGRDNRLLVMAHPFYRNQLQSARAGGGDISLAAVGSVDLSMADQNQWPAVR